MSALQGPICPLCACAIRIIEGPLRVCLESITDHQNPLHVASFDRHRESMRRWAKEAEDPKKIDY